MAQGVPIGTLLGSRAYLVMVRPRYHAGINFITSHQRQKFEI